MRMQQTMPATLRGVPPPPPLSARPPVRLPASVQIRLPRNTSTAEPSAYSADLGGPFRASAHSGP